MSRTVLLGALLTFIIPEAGAQQRTVGPSRIAHVVDSVASTAMADGLSPALGVAVTLDGRTILERSYGLADASAGIRADQRTLWYIASTSKSLTGFGASLLANEGVIRFDAPIRALLPSARWHDEANTDDLTLARFLSHTHHLNDNAVVMSAAFTGAIPEAEWPRLVALARPRPTRDLVYSNFGYNIAAMVIDAARPEGWRRFLQERVYAPAGMRETYTRVSGLDARRIAKSHALQADGRYVTEPFFKVDATMNSAGGHLATLGDLARWTIVQVDSGVIDGRRVFPSAAVALSHRLIAEQTRDQSKRFGYFDRIGWGAGWDIGTYEGERMVSRFGGYMSTQSRLGFLPGRRIGVVAMSTGGLGGPVSDLLMALAFDLEAGRPDAITRAGERLTRVRERRAEAMREEAAFAVTRAERQQQPLARPRADFTGSFTNPDYGQVSFMLQGDSLSYQWGALYSGVEIYDAAANQLRLELAGSGSVAEFHFAGAGPATEVVVSGITFRRAP